MSKYRAEGHAIDEAGQPVHVDIDPFIPTGTCAICVDVPQETEPPEDRGASPESQT